MNWKTLLLAIVLLSGCPEVKTVEHKEQSFASPSPSPIKQIVHYNYATPLPKLLETPIDKTQIKFIVSKSQYQLSVYYKNKKIKTYPVVLGPDPVPDKRQEGDGRTPEGHFKIQALYPHPSWSKFMWLDYPTPDSWKKHQVSKTKGEIPANANIGGEIGIHGVPKDRDNWIDQQQNWTAGCVSLKNTDINELYQVAQMGTKIEINP